MQEYKFFRLIAIRQSHYLHVQSITPWAVSKCLEATNDRKKSGTEVQGNSVELMKSYSAIGGMKSWAKVLPKALATKGNQIIMVFLIRRWGRDG